MPGRISTDIDSAVAELRAGFCVGMPTETVYGLAGDALRPEAVARIFEIKARPSFDPLIVHVPDQESLGTVALGLSDKAKRLAEKFWPGPLTLILSKRPEVPDLVTSGLETVAVRIPSHPLALKLLKQFGRPLAAPSANRFGRISPTTAQAVYEELGDKINLILDGGACSVGVESTIVRVMDSSVQVLRAGGISIEEIESVVGNVELMNQPKERPDAPGQLWHHYAPAKQMIIVPDDKALALSANEETGLIAWGKVCSDRFGWSRSLSEKCDFVEAASRLFALMREADAAPVKKIVVRLLPEVGLGRAINERLRRAGTVKDLA